jgi:LmbE family N-acetylglucosaminyl deacetylase
MPRVNDLGSILGVWAHPDDEGYLSAGIMATAVRRGHRVVCVTATRGEAADPDRWPPSELARIREAEIRECLTILGVTEHRWLDYADGSCADVDPDTAADRISAIIDEVRPTTVLTFGPDGQTGHPDHRAVSEWTARAVARASSAPALYFSTNSTGWAERWETLGLETNVMMGAETLPRTPAHELAVHEVFDGELLDLKERAMCAQATQVLELRDAVGPEVFRELLREEAFRLPDAVP